MRVDPRASCSPRTGFSLIEVLASTAILLISLVAISALLDASSRNARRIEQQSQAIVYAQSKLSELIAGVIPVSSGGSGTMEDDPNWQWSVESEADSTTTGLWHVTVKMTHQIKGSPHSFETSLQQWIMDPSYRGNVIPSVVTAIPTLPSTSSGSGSGGSSSSSSSGSMASGSSSSSATPSSSTKTATPAASTSTKSSTPAASTSTPAASSKTSAPSSMGSGK